MNHRKFASHRATLLGCLAFFTMGLLGFALADDPPQTGPETEKRFPPLKVPAGFKATLFVCDPLIEYPSAIALGPKPGSLFVAVDYMTGLGTEIVRRDEIRLIEDTNGDGYADKATVYAGGFNSIEGMTFHDGVVYAMHSPLLTALRDTDSDGVADERKDLLTGLGLAPEDNPPRLHCANGITWGYDSWLYLALGDHGCNVPRPEGDRLVFNGGGILRCRTDGRDLHVFSTGLRNIYDVALDDDLNVFVRDNENDGGDYKIRVCHSFFGADHGYPYLYYERPDEALPPLADLGLGSSAGGVAYLEQQFPPEYRGSLFFCEWGRAVMRYVPERSGSGFAPIKEIEFAASAENDPYGFKPTDIVVDRDGSLLIADWCDGQRPKRGRGRIYRVRYIGNGETGESRRVGSAHQGVVGEAHPTPTQLGVRNRRMAVWNLARKRGTDAINDLFEIARSDPDATVRVQAVRAIADLSDPVLAQHRLDAGRGDVQSAARLARLSSDPDPRVVRESVIAVSRLRWSAAPSWISEVLKKPDPATEHAAMQALRRAENGPGIVPLLDRANTDPVRGVSLRAIADQFDAAIVDALMDRVRADLEPSADRRRAYADALTRVYQKPGPWTYWGYRPPPRPPNSVEWERTPQIKHAVNAVLLDPDRAVRLATLRRMQREQVPTILDTLEAWLNDERDPERVAAILESVKEHRTTLARDLLLKIVRETGHATPNRLNALAQAVANLDEDSERLLLDWASDVEDGPVLAAVLQRIGKRPKLGAEPVVIGKLKSPSAEVRAAAAEALADLRATAGGGAIRTLLDDGDARVRRAAAAAVGKLEVRSATESLLKLAGDSDAAVRRASLHSLQLLHEPRVLQAAIGAANDSETALEALACIGTFGSPDHARLVADVARRNTSAEILHQAISNLTRWETTPGLPTATLTNLHRVAAELQGTSGVIASWNLIGPLTGELATQIAKESGPSGSRLYTPKIGPVQWTRELARLSNANFIIIPSAAGKAGPNEFWIGTSDLEITDGTAVQFLASSSGTMRVWLNGEAVYQRGQPGTLQPDSDRFEGKLVQGTNRIVVQVSAANPSNVSYHVRFRRKSSRAEHEQLSQAALARPGSAERGRKLFFDAEKSQCIKCHRLGEQGERIGPELTGVGNRFSRIHIIESILEPSRTLAPSYESVLVALKDGRILTGLRIAETDTTLTLADNQAAKHAIEKSAIEERKNQPTSIMPDGLEKRFTTDEFVDLIAYLVGQK